MKWKPVDDNTPKNCLVLGWDKKQMGGKGLPRVMFWAKNLSTNKYAWMSLELAVEFNPEFWCEIELPEQIGASQ